MLVQLYWYYRGIVKFNRSGKEVSYLLDDEHIVRLFELGFAHIKDSR